MLKKYRKTIDDIDEKILKLLNKRATTAKLVAEYKKKSNNNIIFRPDRESQIIRQLSENNTGPLKKNHIHNIYREIISSCLSLEANLKVSFLGPEGTYSELATTKFFGSSIMQDSKSNILEVFNAVKNKTSDYGVVPIENSNQGSIKTTLDFLLKYKVNICGEQNIPIKHCLMSKTKKIENIKKVYAHNQTLSQCASWLSKNMPNVEFIESDSNAQAALKAKKLKNTACIANIGCSDIYKIPIIARNIHDIHNNTTRFIVIGNSYVEKSGVDKTSFIMSIHNKAGELSKILEILATNKISMTKIESIPTKQKNWEYLFVIDIMGHISDKKLSLSLKNIEKKSKYFQLLGSYPKSID